MEPRALSGSSTSWASRAAEGVVWRRGHRGGTEVATVGEQAEVDQRLAQRRGSTSTIGASKITAITSAPITNG